MAERVDVIASAKFAFALEKKQNSGPWRPAQNGHDRERASITDGSWVAKKPDTYERQLARPHLGEADMICLPGADRTSQCNANSQPLLQYQHWPRDRVSRVRRLRL
jgi:hypothetical protein